MRREHVRQWMTYGVLAALVSFAGAAAPTLEEADGLFQAQEWGDAAAAYGAIVEEQPRNPIAWLRLSIALHEGGDVERAAEAHRKVAEFPFLRSRGMYNLACAEALLGRKEAALEALAGALEAGFLDVDQFERDTDLAGLRGEARFGELREQLLRAAEKYRTFDFWVGEWDVYTPGGTLVGRNRIERSENGFLILEHWTSAGGGTGRSMNFVDPADGKWKQVWVDASGNVVRYEGAFVDGAMRFTGTYAPRGGEVQEARASITPSADGTVRQLIEHSKHGGETWEVYFDGVYVRRGEEREGEEG